MTAVCPWIPIRIRIMILFWIPHIVLLVLVDTEYIKQKKRSENVSEKKTDGAPSGNQDEVLSKLPDTTYPPNPVDNELSKKIINDFYV